VKIRDLGEFGLIARIKDRLPTPPSSVLKGIGDDASVTAPAPGKETVTTADLLVEGVHFDFSLQSPYSLGKKALAVNISDIAAMGASPKYAFLSLAIPQGMKLQNLDLFIKGFLEIACNYKIFLLGGDTSASPGPFFINVGLIGEGNRENLVFRSGARPGDDLYVTGTLGDSLFGLMIARSGGKRRLSPEEEYLLKRHFDPTPRAREGRALGEKGLVRSMIDLSDGLLADLGHICEESGTGARLWAERLPLSPALRRMAARQGRPAWEAALRGGEDYELLFSAPPQHAARIATLGRRWSCGVARIGRIEPPGVGLVIESEDGPVDPRLFRGYDHFGGKGTEKETPPGKNKKDRRSRCR
jgi:thiamine-monophosphate kinase